MARKENNNKMNDKQTRPDILKPGKQLHCIK